MLVTYCHEKIIVMISFSCLGTYRKVVILVVCSGVNRDAAGDGRHPSQELQSPQVPPDFSEVNGRGGSTAYL